MDGWNIEEKKGFLYQCNTLMTFVIQFSILYAINFPAH